MRQQSFFVFGRFFVYKRLSGNPGHDSGAGIYEEKGDSTANTVCALDRLGASTARDTRPLR